MKKLISISFLSIFGAYLVYLEASSLIIPNYPQEWDLVSVGMKQSEVHRNIPTIDKNWIEVKGFEQVGKEYGESYWTLSVYYDQYQKVSKIEKRYVYRSLGFFNKHITQE